MNILNEHELKIHNGNTVLDYLVVREKAGQKASSSFS